MTLWSCMISTSYRKQRQACVIQSTIWDTRTHERVLKKPLLCTTVWYVYWADNGWLKSPPTI